MITVQLNRELYEYDIHSLVQAFYPRHDVLVRAMPEENFPESALHITVDYPLTEECGTIRFAFYDQGAGGETEIGRSVREDPDAVQSQPRPSLTGGVFADLSDRRKTRNLLKQKLYELLSAYTGRKLPWGTLTGIRPTKIPMELLEAGRSGAEIRSFMRDAYFVSEQKIDLSLRVAEKELELLKQINYERGYSLYINIPFCPSTCLYCSFTSYPLEKWAARTDEYLDALERELEFVAGACRERQLDTVYIGGGTPTTLTPAQLDRLLEKIGVTFGLLDSGGKFRYAVVPGSGGQLPGFTAEASRPGAGGSHLLEFTVEAGRPDSITREKLEVLKRRNVSRISINPQTMNEETLMLIGRRHTAEQTRESFFLAREMGFDRINMDLIVGLPEEGIEDVRRTFDALEPLKPDNITVHSLAVKRAARLRMQREDYGHLHLENTWETIELTARRCRQLGMEPYYLYRQKNMAGNFENVGYSVPGKEGLYNILMMEDRQPILAVGAGAITKFVLDHGQRIERVENVRDLNHYLARTDEMIERKRKRMEELQWL